MPSVDFWMFVWEECRDEKNLRKMRDAACCRCTHHDTPSVSSFSKREKSCDASSVFEAKEIFRGGSFLRNATDVFICDLEVVEVY